MHHLRSYLGAVGFITGGSVLETAGNCLSLRISDTRDDWTCIFSVLFSAVRAHLLTSAAFHAMLLSAHEQLNDEDQGKRLCSLHALLINIDCSNIDVLEDTALHTISNARSF